MKKIFVIGLYVLAFVVFSIGIILLPSPFHLHNVQGEKVHTRFQTVGDYSFEVLSNIDEFGRFKVEVTNINGENFDYFQIFNENTKIEMLSTKCIIELDRYQFFIHKKSGFSIAKKFENKPSKLTGLMPVIPVMVGTNPCQVLFNSASNFFNIY